MKTTFDSTHTVAHVGLHKTGTSALQRFLKATHSDYFFANNCEFIELVRATASGQHLLLSDESLSGIPYHVDERNTLDRFRDGIRATHRVFQPSQYILGLREHTGFIESCYRQYLAEGGLLDFEEFFTGDPTGVMDLTETGWRDRILFLQQLVGEANVFVYLQEDLARDFDRVKSGLEAFLDTRFSGRSNLPKRNIGVGVRTAKILQTCNRIDEHLERLKLPKLRGQFTKMLGMSSPQICRKWLSWIPQSRRFFSAERAEALKEQFATDWQFAKDSRTYANQIRQAPRDAA